MNVNPFSQKAVIYQNDLDDFKMPYKIYGIVDAEVMVRRYLSLHNNSHGVIVRLFGTTK